ncbi:DNA polymerase I [bacterium]|nr:DNA polymerase I [bacterium]
MSKKLVIVDGTAHIYRAFYAIKPLTDPQGRMVNAVYGFAHMLLNAFDKFSPTHMVVAFDRPEPTHRHQMYPDYKAQREAPPDDLVAQIPLIKELVAAFQVQVCEKAGLEADDLIGTLSRMAEKEKFETLILSSDKDLFQLVTPKVHIARTVRGGKGEYEILDEAGVKRVFGVEPGYVRDMLALMGDASDNIPGVPGVGEKTAIQLVNTYGSLEEIYRSVDKISKSKLREKLVDNQALAEQSYALVKIIEDVPIAFQLKECVVGKKLPESGFHALAGFGFKRLLMSRGMSAGAPAAEWTKGIEAATTIADVITRAQKKKQVVIEIFPQGIALAADAVLPFWIAAPIETLPELLRHGGDWVSLLTDKAIKKISYDMKPLVTALFKAGLEMAGPYVDLHLAAHLIDLPSNKLEQFITRVLGGAWPEDRPEAAACAIVMIAPSMDNRLAAVDGGELYRTLELPLLPVLAKMEAMGVAIDVKALEEMSQAMGQEIGVLEKVVWEIAGVEFNLRSPQQLAEILFERLGLLPGKKTKTGRSTGVDVLENLTDQHPLPAKLLEFRQLQKLKSTYLDVLPGLIDQRDKRIHTSFHQVGAATGRLSSSEPNLQNIPIRTERGRVLRKMFIAGNSEKRILSADYSQIELRLLAHLSQDKQMLKDFVDKLDIHSATAADIFKVPLEDVTTDMRRQAKTCNFGIAYGVSPYGLSRQLRIPPMRAKDFIDGFYARYPGVRIYLDHLLEAARENGYVETLMGRRRMTPDILAANRNIREAAERMAINTPVQGSAADIIKKAMIDIDQSLFAETWQSRMILQVHDELLFEGPEAEMETLKQTVVEKMSGVVALRVELTVEAAWGRNWMEAHT